MSATVCPVETLALRFCSLPEYGRCELGTVVVVTRAGKSRKEQDEEMLKEKRDGGGKKRRRGGVEKD